jgi:hypothetical protein
MDAFRLEPSSPSLSSRAFVDFRPAPFLLCGLDGTVVEHIMSACRRAGLDPRVEIGRRRSGCGGDLPVRVQEGAGMRARGRRLWPVKHGRREASQGRHQVGAVQEGHPTPLQWRRLWRPHRVRREARHHAPHHFSVVVAGKLDAAVTINLATTNGERSIILGKGQRQPKTCTGASSQWPRIYTCAMSPRRSASPSPPGARSTACLPIFPHVAQIVKPTAACWAEKHNKVNASVVDKGYTRAKYVSAVPTEHIAKVSSEEKGATETY